MCLVAAPRSTHQPGVPAPPLLEFPDVPLNPAQNGRVREFDPALAHPIHQIARTQFVTEYHLTHRMMTCWSKCRPLNRSVSAAVIHAIMPVQPTFRLCTRTLQRNQKSTLRSLFTPNSTGYCRKLSAEDKVRHFTRRQHGGESQS